MRHHVYLSTPGLALGDPLTTGTASQRGLILPESAASTEQIAVRIAPEGLGCSDMVGPAVKDAITESPAYLHPEKLGPVYHAVTHHTPDAAAVVAQLGSDAALRHPATTLKNGPRGVIDALGQAALYLESDQRSEATCAVVSAGVAWSTTPRERWQYETPPGDGAGAVIVSKEPGPLRLLATATHVDTILALRTHDTTGTAEALDVALKRVVAHALRDAELEPDDINYLITPFGAVRAAAAPGAARESKRALRAVLPNVDQREFERHVELGRNIGSLGTTDLIVGLHGLLRSDGPLQPGQHVLLLVGCNNGAVGAAVLMVE